MVITVDAETHFAEQGGKRRIGKDRHLMHGAVVGRVHVVIHRAPMLGGQILIQRAAEADVQQLNAAADAEDRLVRIERAPDGAERLNAAFSQKRLHCLLRNPSLVVDRIEQNRLFHLPQQCFIQRIPHNIYLHSTIFFLYNIIFPLKSK